ncbi:unnamed protein product [Lota lota]
MWHVNVWQLTASKLLRMLSSRRHRSTTTNDDSYPGVGDGWQRLAEAQGLSQGPGPCPQRGADHTQFVHQKTPILGLARYFRGLGAGHRHGQDVWTMGSMPLAS